MTTRINTVDAFPAAPEALGLPGEAELARLAARFFNEPPSSVPLEARTPEAAPRTEQDGQETAAQPIFDVPLPDILELANWTPPDARTGSPFYFLDDAPPLYPAGISVPVTRPAPGLAPFSSGQAIPGQPFDVHAVRNDFPILAETVNGRSLVWLDNAATTQKPQAVIDRLAYFYAHENSNIHRAAHELAARATDAFEAARETVRRFVHARSVNEIIFVRGTTEGINLVAQSWGRQHLLPGDEILITWLEHHANIVPWQQLAAQTGAALKVAPVNDRGEISLDEYTRLLGPKTRFVAFTQVSNALGTVTPAAEMTRLAQACGAKVLIDGAQSVLHMRTDVQALGCDWFVFSGHKVFGPTGIGALYGKEELLNATDPWQGGGNMIQDVTFERTLYQDAPARFEAGTGNIAGAVGLGAALEYVERIGIDNIARHEHDLLRYGTRLLSEIPGLKIIGQAAEKAGVLSFVLEGRGTLEIGSALNKAGIAVRAGHHCAQPILRRFGLEATVRPSLALYNTHDDLDALAAALLKLVRTGKPGG
ncbi:MAG: SufS family cysteine desulfurase [Zoogloeaceae bacterium]|jgi:cysteine desulfurase/selenocysteine lyase|nr:SufS family cysteine desulfurase [Zoogloeaceae bacterium]